MSEIRKHPELEHLTMCISCVTVDRYNIVMQYVICAPNNPSGPDVTCIVVHHLLDLQFYLSCFQPCSNFLQVIFFNQ